MSITHAWSNRLRSAVKTFLLASFLAVLGFSYALATQSDPDNGASSSADSRAVTSRAVGAPLRFTNAYLKPGADPGYPKGGNTNTDPKGFDLGDATQGAVFTRYLTATGGGFPYTFATKPNFDVFGSNVGVPLPPPPIPKVFANGRITDSFNNPVGGAARFNAVVTDFLGTQRTGTFRINVFPIVPPQPFRFALDVLPAAQLGNSYYTKIETISAPGPVTFSAIIGSVMVNGTSVASLEAIGLTLAPDGTLFGRPSFTFPAGNATSTTVQFIARATSTKGDAVSRTSATPNQVITFQVENTTQASSEVVASSCTINSTAPATGLNSLGVDSFTYNGAFDPKGQTLNSLAGSPFTLRINGAVLSGSFDDKGNIKNTKGLNVSISTDHASIKIRINGADLSSTVASATAKTADVVLSMEFKHYITCEALTMAQRTRSGKSVLSYNLAARKGSTKAGGMQIITANGVDQKFFDGTKGDKGTDGDAWFVRFLGVPRFSIDSNAAAAFPIRDPKLGANQSGSVSATITLGDDTLTAVTAKVRSIELHYKGTSTTAGVYELFLDGQRFVHTVQINSIPPSDTGIPQAINSKAQTILRFGLDLTGFSGGTGRIIAPDTARWRSR